jgi:hypothetical protein
MIDDDLERLLDAMRQENAAAHADTRSGFDVAVDVMRQENADTRSHFDVVAEAMRHENADTRGHFDVVAEAMRHEIRLVVESVAQVGERLDRTAADIREEMRRGFADTQAMIKFSHAELDRRVRGLEEGFADLQARVERLEGSTH